MSGFLVGTILFLIFAIMIGPRTPPVHRALEAAHIAAPLYRCPICGRGVDLGATWPGTLMEDWHRGSAVCEKCAGIARIRNIRYVLTHSVGPIAWREPGQSWEDCLKMLPHGGTLVLPDRHGSFYYNRILPPDPNRSPDGTIVSVYFNDEGL